MPAGPTADHRDHVEAARIATETGRMLVKLRTQQAPAQTLDIGARADRAAHELIAAELAEAFPADAVLSEEAADDRSRLAAERVWIVDPLDGTREYGMPPRTDWAVHIALVAGGEVIAAAVALPALGTTLATDPPPTPPLDRSGRIRVVVSESRRPPAAVAVAEALEAELLVMGSAGAKAMAVVRGEAEVYAHGGGINEWDLAAPAGVAAAAGLHVSRLDGSPIRFNQEVPRVPDFLICHPAVADRAVAASRAGAP